MERLKPNATLTLNPGSKNPGETGLLFESRNSENSKGLNPVTVEINPRVIAVRESDWPIKVFYSVMRHLKESGNTSIVDIGSSVGVDREEMEVINTIIEKGHRESLSDGHYTEYPSSWGLFRLRESIAALFQKRAGIMLDPNKEIMVTGGIIKAVDAAIQSLDITHVAIPSLAPYFARSLAILRGKQVIDVPLDLKTGNFDLEILEERLAEKQVERGKVLMYMTLPSAPAGTLPYERFIEKELIPFARRHNMPVISDTYIFATTFSGKPIRPLMSYPNSTDVAVEAITVAKELGLSGIRIGGVVGNPEIINAMRLLAACSLEMLPTPNQNIAAIALDSIRPESIGERLAKDLFIDILPRFEKMKWPVIIPQAGLDMLVEIPKGYQDVETTVDRSLLTSLSLLLQYGVAFCPASVFGPDGDKYLRIVLKQRGSKIVTALDKLGRAGFDWEIARPTNEIITQTQDLVEHLDLTRL